ELAKIAPTGAFEKNGLRKFCTALLFSTGVSLERLPVCLKTYSWDAGDVRNLTRSAASAWCDDWLVTERNEPPHLPPPPGTFPISHLPFVAGAWPWMSPIIHAGQATVAKVPFLKPVFQSLVNAASPRS